MGKYGFRGSQAESSGATAKEAWQHEVMWGKPLMASSSLKLGSLVATAMVLAWGCDAPGHLEPPKPQNN
eukprot:3387115-Amphidinium_carterae.1